MNARPLSPTEQTLVDILVSELKVHPSVFAESGAATLLIGQGVGLDSMEALSLTVEIEERFDIEVADDELTIDVFKDLQTLGEFVTAKRGGAA